MKIKFLTYLIVIAICISCKENKPSLYLAQNDFNLDTVSASETIIQKILIRNTGNEDLVIEKFTCGCECTIPDIIDGQTITVEDSLTMKVSIKAYPKDSGKWKKVLCTFKSNSDSIFTHLSFLYYTR